MPRKRSRGRQSGKIKGEFKVRNCAFLSLLPAADKGHATFNAGSVSDNDADVNTNALQPTRIVTHVNEQREGKQSQFLLVLEVLTLSLQRHVGSAMILSPPFSTRQTRVHITED